MDRNIPYGGSVITISVATREGGVDRNIISLLEIEVKPVATREGGVDRNAQYRPRAVNSSCVATREGGVDRNTVCFPLRT